MYKIAFVYEHISREYEAYKYLQNKLEEISDVQVYYYSLHFQTWDIYAENKKKKFDAIVVPYVYKESSLMHIEYVLKNNKNTIVFNLHHEQLSPPFDEPRMLPCDAVSKNEVVHLVWNEKFQNKLIRVGVDPKKIYVTGNIRTDICKKKRNIRESLAKEFQLEYDKKWILICESWGEMINDSMIEKRKLVGVNEKDMREFNASTRKALDSFTNQTYELSDKFFNSFELIYRNHPGAQNTLNLDPRIKLISSYSVYDWFEAVEVCVARNSTTLFEAERAQVLPIRYDPTNMDLKFVQEGIEEYKTITCLNELTEPFLDSLDKNSKEIYKKYLGECDGKSAERVAEVIINNLTCGLNYYKNENAKTNLVLFLRKAIMNQLSKIALKYHIKNAGKFIKSLEIFKNDIPYEWK